MGKYQGFDRDKALVTGLLKKHLISAQSINGVPVKQDCITVLDVVATILDEIRCAGGDASVLHEWVGKVQSSGFADSPLKSKNDVLLLFWKPDGFVKQVGLPDAFEGSPSKFRELFVAAWQVQWRRTKPSKIKAI